MKVTPCAIADALLIEPRVFGDERGFFFESFNQRAFNLATGLAPSFVQDNHSKSARGVLRDRGLIRGALAGQPPVDGKWAGLAHGFLVLSETAEFLYKTTDYYAPEFERCIAWNDPDLAIVWPTPQGGPQLSAKDAAGVTFLQAELTD